MVYSVLSKGKKSNYTKSTWFYIWNQVCGSNYTNVVDFIYKIKCMDPTTVKTHDFIYKILYTWFYIQNQVYEESSVWTKFHTLDFIY